ncbi:hypothetical protein [Gloeothece verrucosa]|uniref:Uncharacterized protein n=1 Tax=Gloeothece verrucosa (strain PCC 7822) TaxID=497965 RepID=E0UFP4_GLOV7|nr:hypothetical protein [Gloeothece verrucosa]ADN13155.1 hypothetical protein Cyan7822_1148 [Gloeothece verrucosa PCC 7822]
MNYTIEIDQEALAKVQALAIRVLEDKIAPGSKISYTQVET